MSEGPLERPRDLNALVSHAVGLYGRNFLSYAAVAAAVVVPAQLIVSGVGLGQLTAGYDASPPQAEVLVPVVLSYVVITPLVTAMCLQLMRMQASGEDVRPGRAISLGLEAFTPLFLTVVLAAVAIAAGLLLLIVPGIYLAIRLYFAPQAVLVDGRSGGEGLAATWELVAGRWWRTLGCVVVFNLATAAPALILQAPLDALADSLDRQVVVLAGQIVIETLAAPLVAVASTLLFFDLKARPV